MTGAADPGTLMAAERTLLAWVRTGLAVMALGFVLARHGGSDDVLLAVLGVGLVLVGTVGIALAAWQHHRLYQSWGMGSPPQRALAVWSIWFAVVVALIGAALVVALVVHPVPAGFTPPPILPGSRPVP